MSNETKTVTVVEILIESEDSDTRDHSGDVVYIGDDRTKTIEWCENNLEVLDDQRSLHVLDDEDWVSFWIYEKEINNYESFTQVGSVDDHGMFRPAS